MLLFVVVDGRRVVFMFALVFMCPIAVRRHIILQALGENILKTFTFADNSRIENFEFIDYLVLLLLLLLI